MKPLQESIGHSGIKVSSTPDPDNQSEKGAVGKDQNPKPEQKSDKSPV